MFGDMLPDLWYEHRDIAPGQRIFNDSAGQGAGDTSGVLLSLTAVGQRDRS